MPGDRKNLSNDDSDNSETLNFTANELLDNLVQCLGFDKPEPKQSDGWFRLGVIINYLKNKYPERKYTYDFIKQRFLRAYQRDLVDRDGYKGKTYYRLKDGVDLCNIVW